MDGAPVAQAQALLDLGAALRRGRERAAGRPVLAEALDIALRHGAGRIAAAARTELAGVASLTPSERRVAELAARGLTNPEIAGLLYITPRTVEGHLTHVYAKLDLQSRNQLAATLKGDSPL